MASSPVIESEPASAMLPTKQTATGWGLFRGASSVVIVLLVVGALAWIVFGYGTGHFVDADAKRVLERQKILADRNAEDDKLLHAPASFMAKDKGIVRVPIDDAVKMTIEDLKPVQPHPAYPIKQSPPQPANAPTSPDKGAGASSATTNPAASNPTMGQPAPASPSPAPSSSAPGLVPSAAPTTPAPDSNAKNPVHAAQPAAPAAVVAGGTTPEPSTAPPLQPTPIGTVPAPEYSTATPPSNAPGASPTGTP